MTDFTHIHKDFAAFSHFYTDEIEPKLHDLEKERLTKVSRFKAWRTGAIVAGLGIGGVAFSMWSIEAGVILGLIATGVGFAIGYAPLGTLRKTAHEDILPKIADNLGMTLTPTELQPPAFDRFRHFKLIPDCDRSSFEDFLSGSRQAAEFDIYEAKLERESRDSDGDTTWTTVFHGQLFRIDYHKKFLGETVVMRDVGFFNRFTKPEKGFQKVGLASLKFEKAFEAWSTDQVEARELLDPIVLERFLELERLYEGKSLRAAWADDSLYIVMETGDRMQMGSIFKPMNGQERIETILKEFATIYDLIDVVIKPVKARMSGSFSVEDL